MQLKKAPRCLSEGMPLAGRLSITRGSHMPGVLSLSARGQAEPQVSDRMTASTLIRVQ